jgi:hypothetical protein
MSDTPDNVFIPHKDARLIDQGPRPGDFPLHHYLDRQEEPTEVYCLHCGPIAHIKWPSSLGVGGHKCPVCKTRWLDLRAPTMPLKFGPLYDVEKVRIDQKALDEADRSNESLRELIDKQTAALLQRIYAQREEILTAFVAKYGCGPEEAVQVQRMTPDGMRWWVERVKQPEATQ